METRKVIVTHTAPDLDAIGYVWLLKRFWPPFAEADIKLMPFNQIDRAVLEAADSVGDIGGVYDPGEMRFDHHHFPGDESTATCAAKMVWEYLVALGVVVSYLEPLIEVIYQGDLARTEPVGIHTLLWGTMTRKNLVTGQRLTDQEMMAAGFDLLDRADAWLKRKAEVAAELAPLVVWKSEDGLVWAIRGGSASTNFAAYEQGCRVAVYEGKPVSLPAGVTYSMGASRSPEWKSPHLGDLVEKVLRVSDGPDAVADELEMWYRHQDGFFAGRGGPKAPNFEPPRVDLAEVARVLDMCWRRERLVDEWTPSLDDILSLAAKLPSGLDDAGAADKLLVERDELLEALAEEDLVGALTEAADAGYYVAKHLDWVARRLSERFERTVTVTDIWRLTAAKYKMRAREGNPKDEIAERVSCWAMFWPPDFQREKEEDGGT